MKADPPAQSQPWPAPSRAGTQGLIHAPDMHVATTHFNWLVMAEPVNRAMLLGDAAVPEPAELERHAAEAVRIFLAAYGR
jgi:hypothetical protein